MTDDYDRMRSIADGWQQRAYRAERAMEVVQGELDGLRAEVERLRGALDGLATRWENAGTWLGPGTTRSR